MTQPLNARETTLIAEIERGLTTADPRLDRLLRRRTTPARLWLWRAPSLVLVVACAAVLTLAAVVTAGTVTPWAAVAAGPGVLTLGAAFRRLGGLRLF
ncbi:DUF3040 domain-containing protein [Kitasatospora sp. NPDC096147]|uniref:DUF3040 domain-containing protein n=1 Tax=Kitasatospora sp. NPDC096147 TaxID=3364093 RepID=UPI00382465AB